jgi:hypothetical protein
MKAAFTLVPSESKRLIGKAVAQMEEVKRANEKGYIILCGGTTNAYVGQELGLKINPARWTGGVCMRGLLCDTAEQDREAINAVIHNGQIVKMELVQALQDFHIETVVIKPANAVDPEGSVGIITAGFDGGTVARFIGTVTSTGLTLIVPVGLEKLVPSVRESAIYTGAKTLDYSMGANFGMYCISKARVVTEIEALKILAGVETKLVAAGGVDGSEGSVVLVIWGDEPKVKKAISIIESIKGEPPVGRIHKQPCKTCRYSCKFVGKDEEDLPAWLR